MGICLRKSLEANFISDSDNKGTHLRSFHLHWCGGGGGVLLTLLPPNSIGRNEAWTR
jgi:hypothetical protein